MKYLRFNCGRTRLSFANKYFVTNTPWIYSNKFEEFKQIQKGRVVVCWNPNTNDLHDISLRMLNELMNSDLIVSQHLKKTEQLLIGLRDKKRFIHQEFRQKINTQIAIQQNRSINELVKLNPNFDLIKSESNKEQLYQMHIQFSKHLQIAQDTHSFYNDSQNSKNKHIKQVNAHQMKKILSEQEQMSDYLNRKYILDLIKKNKLQNGYPSIVSYEDIMGRVSQLRNIGLKIVFVLQQYTIQYNKRILTQLQNYGQKTQGSKSSNEIPYQILPVRNNLLCHLVSAGFPADRFAIQYHLQHKSLDEILITRKNQALTLCIMIKGKYLDLLAEQIITLYGKQQIIYCCLQDNKQFRGQAATLSQFIKNEKSEGQKLYPVVISPYLQSFNEELRLSRDKKSQIVGKLTAQTTNFIEMEYLDYLLNQMKTKDESYRLKKTFIVDQMIKILGKQTATPIISKLLKVKGEQLNKMIENSMANIIPDYIGLNTDPNQYKKSHKKSKKDKKVDQI